jgi:nitrate reductase delta subunit
MNEDTKFQLKLISVLLQYPDDAFSRFLTSVTESIDNLPHSTSKEKLVQFVSSLEGKPLIYLQETYTETFDLNPSTCLNLTYHILGDGEKRGKVMAHFQQIYHQAGYETITGELPDYLPLMLEFLSECPESSGICVLWSYLNPVEKLAGLLKDSGNPYSLLLDIVSDFVREYTSQPDLDTEYEDVSSC